MDTNEKNKLTDHLKKRLRDITAELSVIASVNPAVQGDFDVRVDNLGASQEDTAQEATQLDRRQALVDTLEKEYKEIKNTLAKIKSGTYGK